MRDPMSWALPLFRAYGIQVKLHVFFIVFTLGMFLRQVGMKGNPIWWVDVLLYTVVLLFGIILLHEFGHCFGGRSVGGDAKDILIWPLGGLAYVDIPHNPRAHFITTAAGPAVNVVICAACAIGLLAGGFRPNLNPVADPYLTEMRHANGKTYTSEYGLKLYKPGTSERVPTIFESLDEQLKETSWRGGGPRYVTPASGEQYAALAGAERAVAPGWAVWLQRAFTLSWVLFLFNMIPAYPLDGGQLLQAMVWKRSDYRRGVTVAAYSGFVCAVLFLIVSIWQNEALFMGLSLFMLYQASKALHDLESEDGPFGYDFSAGYTSLERDDPPPPQPKKPGWFARWRQAKRARRLQREAAEQQQDA